EVIRSGYEPQQEWVEVKKGQQLQRSWRLERKTGSLVVNAQPEQAELSLWQQGKEFKRWRGSRLVDGLPIGRYELRVQAEGYGPQTKQLTISWAQTARVTLVLKRVEQNSIVMEFVWVEPGSF
ncbi:carboxypeptidase-like regulatory domain-containing protein, partial [Arthrospira platensis SPKY1]|nr:carboxypeptidase-like regulatory domain-containing protein [Arthrospira platensis SPKY1]